MSASHRSSVLDSNPVTNDSDESGFKYRCLEDVRSCLNVYDHDFLDIHITGMGQLKSSTLPECMKDLISQDFKWYISFIDIYDKEFEEFAKKESSIFEETCKEEMCTFYSVPTVDMQPPSVDALVKVWDILDKFHLVRNEEILHERPIPKLLMHCLMGYGRTGTVLMSYIIYKLMKLRPDTISPDLKAICCEVMCEEYTEEKCEQIRSNDLIQFLMEEIAKYCPYSCLEVFNSTKEIGGAKLFIIRLKRIIEALRMRGLSAEPPCEEKCKCESTFLGRCLDEGATFNHYTNPELDIYVTGMGQIDRSTLPECMTELISKNFKWHISFIDNEDEDQKERSILNDTCNGEMCNYYSVPTTDMMAPTVEAILNLWTILDDFHEVRNEAFTNHQTIPNLVMHCLTGLGQTGTMLMSYIMYRTMKVFSRKYPDNNIHRNIRLICCDVFSDVHTEHKCNKIKFNQLIEYLRRELNNYSPDACNAIFDKTKLEGGTTLFITRIQRIFEALHRRGLSDEPPCEMCDCE